MDRPQRRFYFILARALGKTVRALLAEIDSAELTEWMAFDQIDPVGEDRGDLRAAIVASTVANCNLGEHSTPFEVENFMPRFEPPRIPTREESAAKIHEVMSAFFG